jgi:hypothetical protein
MESLNKQREESKIAEKREASLLLRMVKGQRDNFEFAEASQNLASEKNLEDTMILNNAITNWVLNPKLEESKKKELNDLLLSLWRVMSYCSNLETICKTAVSKYVLTEKRNSELVSEKRILELKLQQLEQIKNKEIDALKKEIEFLNKP